MKQREITLFLLLCLTMNIKQPNILYLSLYRRKNKYAKSVDQIDSKIREKKRMDMQQVFM